MAPLPRELGRRIFAWALTHGQGLLDETYGARKRSLFAGLDGDVLEIGAGAGANLAYLRRGVRWSGIDPNPWMVERARERAAVLGVHASLLRSRGEQIPADDGTFDAVIATLVLCSVRSQPRVLAEIRRVLRPGGRFLFIEHVAARAGTPLRTRQDRVTPLWTRVADGCCPNRETELAIRRAGFSRVEVEAFDVPSPRGIVTPQISGYATR